MLTNTKVILEGTCGPVSQTVKAVKSLLTYKNHPISPLPADVSLDNGRLVLVLSNKKDVYYCLNAISCSCPASTFNPATKCKHQRKYFPAQTTTVKPIAEPENLKPVAKWPGNLNGPVSEIPTDKSAAKAASSISERLIDLWDTSEREAAYWSIKEDKEMLQSEA